MREPSNPRTDDQPMVAPRLRPMNWEHVRSALHATRAIRRDLRPLERVEVVLEHLHRERSW